MIRKRYLSLLASGMVMAGAMATGGALEKKVLDHTSFDAWKAVKNTGLSNNGAVSYTHLTLPTIA